jgi:subtilase family serine protease
VKSTNLAAALAVVFFSRNAGAVAPARVVGAVDDAQRVTLAGSRPQMAVDDLGPLPAATQLHGVTLHFGRTAAQEAQLASLISAQHDIASPLYHRWLNPQQFLSRFGAADSDVEAAAGWLRARGLTVEDASRTRIHFGGTAEQLHAAFGTELHRYADGNFAPAADATIPAALGGLVQGVSNLSSIRPHSHLKPAFTSGQSGNHFLSPADVSTIYDVAPVYAAGFDGTGQTIVVIGQSAITLADIEHFQAAAGVTVHDPQQIIVPNSGASTVVTGDEAESDLDLEYTSSMAPGATIKFVYTGNGTNFNAFNSLQYAIENNLGTIVSSSYGICEASLGSSNYTALNDVLAQAVSQGQSVISASGDTGSTDCAGTSGLNQAQQQALAVDFPASSQFATGIGGTEFTDTSTTFWTPSPGNSADVLSSAKSYVPEQVWNDDAAAGALSSGGGGISIFTARPSFQTGVTGIPSGTKRLVPDVSFSASSGVVPYLYCSSDSAQTGVTTGSCATGFRDSSNVNLTVGGGTSFAAPVFAGMVALINQKFAPTGQGVVAATLYTLAASTPAAFHDITAGGNQCAVAGGCTAASEGSFLAGVGYDEASGLGSVDLSQLLAVWPASGSSLAASKTTLTAASSTASLSTDDSVTILVAAASGSLAATVPTGTVIVTVDGGSATPETLANGSAKYTFTSPIAGAHSVAATYTGDSNYASSSATITITIPTGKTFGLFAADTTIALGGSGSSAIAITPVNGYTGTIAWTVASSPVLSQGCFSIPSTAVTSATSAQLAINAGSSCSASAALEPRGSSRFVMFGFAMIGFFGLRKRRKWLACALLLGGGFTACGGTSAPAAPKVTAGTYAVTVTGTDSATASINASTTLTLTIQ